jgi:hypothetical protein
MDFDRVSAAVQVYTDSHVSTKYHWARPHVLSPESSATITWDIPEGTPAGAHPSSTSLLPFDYSALQHERPTDILSAAENDK